MARKLSSIKGQTLKTSSDAPGISTSKNLVIGSDRITSAISATDFPLQVSGGVYVSGSAGIGTTNPTSKLHVAGDANITGVGTITTFNSTNGTITNLTGTAGTITTFNSTNGTITNGTITNLTGTAGTITTFNSTNGTITNLTNTNLNVTGVVTFSSTQTYPRIPANTQGSSYTLVLSDAGKVVINSSGGVTVPSGVFTAGDVISIYNNSASDIALNQGGSVTMYKAGSATTGNQLIAQRGIAVVLCVASNEFVCSGVK